MIMIRCGRWRLEHYLEYMMMRSGKSDSDWELKEASPPKFARVVQVLKVQTRGRGQGMGGKKVRGQDFKLVRTEREALMTIDKVVIIPLGNSETDIDDSLYLSMVNMDLYLNLPSPTVSDASSSTHYSTLSHSNGLVNGGAKECI
ncbi:hypothetical protein Tco_0563262 [Tanacetum coccineum]